jgi:hypothetical protein
VLLIGYNVMPFVMTFWQQNEQSSSAGGLVVWPAKALLLAGFGLLALQGASEIIKRVAVMRGVIPDPAAEKAPSAAENHDPGVAVVTQFLIHNMAPIMFLPVRADLPAGAAGAPLRHHEQ